MLNYLDLVEIARVCRRMAESHDTEAVRTEFRRMADGFQRRADALAPLVGGTGASFMGNVIYDNIGVAGNLPFAAALAIVPIVIMIIYLAGARAVGAFEDVA